MKENAMSCHLPSKRVATHSRYKWLKANKDLYLAILAIVLVFPLWISMGINNPLVVSIGNPIIQLVLATIIQFGIAGFFYIAWYREVFRNKRLGMYTLIMISSLSAYFYSIYLIVKIASGSSDGYDHIFGLFQGKTLSYLQTLLISHHFEHMYFEVGASIIAFVLLGEGITKLIRDRAVSGLQSLMSLQVKEATIVLDNNEQVKIAAVDIKLNDYLLVRKGDIIPTDGLLHSELAYVNESLLTGESRIVKKFNNDDLIGGTINSGEAFIMQANRIGQDTILARIIAKVDALSQQKSKLEKIADKISAIFTPIVLILAFLTFITYAFILPWFAFDFIREKPYVIAFKTTIAVLVIACPCALGLATPLATLVGVLKATREGIIFNKVEAFEKIKTIDVVAFDKTRTITEGKLSIKEIYGNIKYLDIAITLENISSHPIALAFQAYGEEHKITKVAITKIKEKVSFGITGNFKGNKVVISSVHKLLTSDYLLSEQLQKIIDTSKKQIQLVLGLAINNEIVTLFLLEDQVKMNATNTVALLKEIGIEVYMISGDNEAITATIAKEVGIGNYFANVNPFDKANIIKKIQSQDKKVAFVGDGINDSIALQQADLSLAMGDGAEVAVTMSDIVIVKPDILNIHKALVITKKIRKLIFTNFALAFVYNILAIPIAILSGWIWTSEILPFAMVAAIAMALSSISVVSYSLYYHWKKIDMTSKNWR